MAGRPALFGKAMTTAERQRRRSDRLQYGEEHVGQLYRAGKAAFAFAQALEDVARTYARLEAEHGGGKQLMTEIAERSLRLDVRAQVSSWGSYPTCRVPH